MSQEITMSSKEYLTQTPRQVLKEIGEASLFDVIATFLKIDLAGKSDATVKWYRDRLLAMGEYLGFERPYSEITEADLLIWHAWITGKERGLARDTQRGHVRACKRLFKWASDMGGMPDPAMRLKAGSPRRFVRRGISESNFNRMLEAAKENPRDRALMLFLAASGARRGGAANLRLSDLDLDARQVIVKEKGDQEGTVYLTEDAVEALNAWLAVRPACKDDHVFLGRCNGQDWHGLTPAGITEIMKRYKKRLGLQGSCSPHQFRHRLGRRLSERGVTMGTIAQIMRHKDPSVTVLHYGGLGNHEIQYVYDRALDPTFAESHLKRR
jgi:site-specific recombinase XerD